MDQTHFGFDWPEAETLRVPTIGTIAQWRCLQFIGAAARPVPRGWVTYGGKSRAFLHPPSSRPALFRLLSSRSGTKEAWLQSCYEITPIELTEEFVMKIASALVTGLACILGTVTSASAVVIGLGDDDDYKSLAAAYQSVGQIYGTDSTGSFAASGVLIADSWVLTAAHVTSGATALNFYLDGGGSWDTFGSRSRYTADQIYTYSGWNGNLASGYDIGLFHLSTPVDCSDCFAQRYTGTKEVGGVGTMVGFGTTGTGSGGATAFDGLKRAGRNMIDAVLATNGRTNRILLADFDSGSSVDNNFGSSSMLPLEAMIGPGDSGGGLFETLGSQEYLVGITSFGWGRLDGDPDSDYGDVGGWTRVTYFNNWIDSVIGGSSSPGGGGGKKRNQQQALDLQAARISVPEPGTLALMVLGLAGIGMGWGRK